ncbi:MAG: LON peptidase substrate-binding domain-containing protein [Caulobacteraceae bacterium]
MAAFKKAQDLPLVIPVFPLDGALLLPHGALPLHIFEPRYIKMIDDAMADERIIGMVQTRPGGDPERPGLQPVGCAGKITSFAETGDGRYLITLTGLSRFATREELPTATPYRQVRADFLAYEGDLDPVRDDDQGFDRLRLLGALKAYLEQRSLEVDWETAKAAPAEALVNSLAMALPFDPAEKQALLEAPTLAERRAALVALMEIDACGPSDEDQPPTVQ